MATFKEGLKKISTFIFDVDGVLSDGTVVLLPDGDQARNMNIKDGYALQLAAKLGFNICIISGGNSLTVKSRLNGLGITDVYLKVSEKIEKYEDYLYSNHLSPEEILYMGDDMPDYEVMTKVGIACCPDDAVEEIKSISHYISPSKGGMGCVRDVIEQVLKTQGKWPVF
jgi:3-deoxy-D-manno-octulosonate 8-phosphate phosphatase (KDO 8-P phosphatase)